MCCECRSFLMIVSSGMIMFIVGLLGVVMIFEMMGTRYHWSWWTYHEFRGDLMLGSPKGLQQTVRQRDGSTTNKSGMQQQNMKAADIKKIILWKKEFSCITPPPYLIWPHYKLRRKEWYSNPTRRSAPRIGWENLQESHTSSHLWGFEGKRNGFLHRFFLSPPRPSNLSNPHSNYNRKNRRTTPRAADVHLGVITQVGCQAHYKV